MTDILSGLTDEQREAVTHVKGPLLVVAGPGSGKTRVITRRIAYLLYCGIRPWSVLAITFTNKAAAEMRERVEALGAQKGVWLSTFHAYCARVLREFADRLGYRRDFTIYDAGDSTAVLNTIAKDLELPSTVQMRAVRTAIGAAKERLVSPDEYEYNEKDIFGRTVARVYGEYQKRLVAANAMDFDDLIMKTALLFRRDAEALAKLRQRHQFVLVDEFQDTSRSQYVIAKLLTEEHRNLCATGDPDQSIYGWRGADINNILDFERDYPDAKVVFLGRNYRSTQTILSAADSVVAANQERKARSLYTKNPVGEPIHLIEAADSNDEASRVAAVAKGLLRSGVSPRDIAIFYRVNWLSRQIEEEFVAKGLPYQLVGGVEFYNRKEIKDILAYLRLSLNRADDASLLRAIVIPSRGIGEKTLETVRKTAREGNVPLFEAILAEDFKAGLGPKAAAAVGSFANLLNSITAAGAENAAAAVKTAIAASGYLNMLRLSQKAGDIDRAENLQELVNAAVQYDEKNPGAGLAGFLQQAALVADIDNWRDREDKITLMTMHSAKGLEFPVVIAVGLEEGILPHSFSSRNPKEIEEERRVFFVAMTRAMKSLYLLYAQRRMYEGRWSCHDPSRFLGEIPANLVKYEPAAEIRLPRVKRYRPAASASFRRSAPLGSESPRAFAAPLAASIPKPGTRVSHAQFGTGTIKSVVREGARHKMVVNFTAFGDKKVIYELAHLEIIA